MRLKNYFKKTIFSIFCLLPLSSLIGVCEAYPQITVQQFSDNVNNVAKQSFAPEDTFVDLLTLMNEDFITNYTNLANTFNNHSYPIVVININPTDLTRGIEVYYNRQSSEVFDMPNMLPLAVLAHAPVAILMLLAPNLYNQNINKIPYAKDKINTTLEHCKDTKEFLDHPNLSGKEIPANIKKIMIQELQYDINILTKIKNNQNVSAQEVYTYLNNVKPLITEMTLYVMTIYNQAMDAAVGSIKRFTPKIKFVNIVCATGIATAQSDIFTDRIKTELNNAGIQTNVVNLALISGYSNDEIKNSTFGNIYAERTLSSLILDQNDTELSNDQNQPVLGIVSEENTEKSQQGPTQKKIRDKKLKTIITQHIGA
jgi:hypothetical protein